MMMWGHEEQFCLRYLAPYSLQTSHVSRDTVQLCYNDTTPYILSDWLPSMMTVLIGLTELQFRTLLVLYRLRIFQPLHMPHLKLTPAQPISELSFTVQQSCQTQQPPVHLKDYVLQSVACQNLVWHFPRRGRNVMRLSSCLIHVIWVTLFFS